MAIGTTQKGPRKACYQIGTIPPSQDVAENPCLAISKEGYQGDI
jgi:hypothetical protein